MFRSGIALPSRPLSNRSIDDGGNDEIKKKRGGVARGSESSSSPSLLLIRRYSTRRQIATIRGIYIRTPPSTFFILFIADN